MHSLLNHVTKFRDHSDTVLLKAIAQDDATAFEELFDRYWKKAHAMAMRGTRDIDPAREIVQEIFINFWERRHVVKIENFPAYLAKGIKYKVIDRIKHGVIERKYQEHYRIFAKLHDEDALRTVEFNDLLEAVEDGVKTLPRKTQKVFRLSRFHGHSVPEISNLLGLSEKAIQYHITRSVKELRVHLKDFLLWLLLLMYHG